MSWGQTIILVVTVMIFCGCIAICDINIIKEIKKFREILIQVLEEFERK